MTKTKLHFSPDDTPTQRAEKLNETVEMILQLLDNLARIEVESGKAQDAHNERVQEVLNEISNLYIPALNDV